MPSVALNFVIYDTLYFFGFTDALLNSYFNFWLLSLFFGITRYGISLPLCNSFLFCCFRVNILLDFIFLINFHSLYFKFVLLLFNSLIAIQIIVQVNKFWECYTVVYLHTCECTVVKSEPIQHYRKQFRPLCQIYTSLRILLFVARLTKILIRSSK